MANLFLSGRDSTAITMFRPDPDTAYMMPAHFGGDPFDPSFQARQKATMLTVTFETDRAELERYIPGGSTSGHPRCRSPSAS